MSTARIEHPRVVPWLAVALCAGITFDLISDVWLTMCFAFLAFSQLDLLNRINALESSPKGSESSMSLDKG